jgi:hypothetical protein
MTFVGAVTKLVRTVASSCADALADVVRQLERGITMWRTADPFARLWTSVFADVRTTHWSELREITVPQCPRDVLFNGLVAGVAQRTADEAWTAVDDYVRTTMRTVLEVTIECDEPGSFVVTIERKA